MRSPSPWQARQPVSAVGDWAASVPALAVFSGSWGSSCRLHTRNRPTAPYFRVPNASPPLLRSAGSCCGGFALPHFETAGPAGVCGCLPPPALPLPSARGSGECLAAVVFRPFRPFPFSPLSLTLFWGSPFPAGVFFPALPFRPLLSVLSSRLPEAPGRSSTWFPRLRTPSFLCLRVLLGRGARLSSFHVACFVSSLPPLSPLQDVCRSLPIFTSFSSFFLES